MNSASVETALQAFLARVKPCPAPGDGVHGWVYHAACCAVDAGLPDEEAILEIEALMTRDPNGSEIEDALAAARGERKSRQPRWSRPDPVAITKIANKGLTLKKVIERSPAPIDLAGPPETDNLIDLLFPGDPWLCCGRTDWMMYRRRKSVWLAMSLDSDKLQSFSLVVPSPMTEQWGRTKKGEISYHAESNTGNRRFLVCEFDSGPLDQQAALLWELAQYAPLAVIVFSGSKSLHGFFFCEAQSEEKLQRFFNYATSLGADPRTWLRSQFVRLPEGRRNGEFDA